MGRFLVILTKKEGIPMLRLVAEGEQAPRNEALCAALDRVTRGSPTQTGLSILDEHEAEALYRVLASRSFTQAQLDTWIDRLLADHPYDRSKRVGVRPGLLVWVGWVIFGGEKPLTAITESATDWRKRAEAFVDECISSVDEPSWLERPLRDLVVARLQIGQETGKSEWHMLVLRWALIQLLTISSEVATSDTHATG